MEVKLLPFTLTINVPLNSKRNHVALYDKTSLSWVELVGDNGGSPWLRKPLILCEVV